jgi:diacylglycerol O-acyltransferase
MPATASNGVLGDSRVLRPLSDEDLAILALESRTVAGHTCKVILLDGPIEPARLRAHIASRVDRAPEFAMRLCEIDGTLSWVRGPEVNVSEHVSVLDLPEPPDEASLRAAVARIFAQRLDRSRPLWQIDLVPALADGGSALIWRTHHALADGSTAMRMASVALWDGEGDGSPDSPATRELPGQAVPTHHAEPIPHQRLETWRAAVRETPQHWLRSPFGGEIGAERSVGFATVEFGALRRAAKVIDGATVNDAVLTVVAGALRRWLEARHGHLGQVRIKVPVSLHRLRLSDEDERADVGNRDSFFCVDVPLAPGDPAARLNAVARATRARKNGHDAEHLDAMMHRLGRTPHLQQFAQRVLTHPRSFALNVSNVPGPRRPVHVLGVPARALYSLAEIREDHALRVAVVSMADTLNFGLTADPSLLGDIAELAGEIPPMADALIECAAAR